ncbi:hypothetical protein EDD29_4251 [Actinocorallia herbida]|uniref:VOC domain-containing protein n=1 Tax=Actinocorallia herbida TaxID=58109 RepID=A0A3N1CZF8_9ACTN|nr:hypothetical protein EDD29_4251 [Actinocorallia herbida]
MRFYGELFGWEIVPLREGYLRFTLDGAAVAGVWPEPASSGAAGWTVYFTVEDIRALTLLVEEAGGRVVMEPTELEDYGVLGGYLDPEGVHFMGWQPRSKAGAEVVAEDRTWAWTELFTRDMEAAESFYPRVFGWGRARQGLRVRWITEGRPVASMLPITPEVPDEALATWLVHFCVPDVEAAARRAEELGAHRIATYTDPLYGLGVSLTDPQNATFLLTSTSTALARARPPSREPDEDGPEGF